MITTPLYSEPRRHSATDDGASRSGAAVGEALPAVVVPAPGAAVSAGRPPARPRPRKRVVTRARAIAAVVLVAVAALVFAVMRPQPLDVDVARVARGDMHVTVDADAVTRVRARFTVAAPVTGLVERIALAEGDSVRAGDVVAVITASPADPTSRRMAAAHLEVARATLGEAEARARQVQANLAQAERDLVRTQRLAAAGALAERDVESATLAVTARRSDLDAVRAQSRLAAAEVAQARAALDAAAGTAAPATVRAPGAGRVLRIPERSARVATAGTPLLEVGDPASLEVSADVLSIDAASIRAGQEVALRGWGGAPLAGRVRRVEPSARTHVSALGVEEQRLAVIIDLDRPPPTLGDGYRLVASTTVWEGRGVLRVPAGALLRTSAGWQLFVVEDGRARRRDVRIGHVGGADAEVLGGLREGETIVLFPSDKLRDGERVRARG